MASHVHGYTQDFSEWCPCSAFPLVEEGKDGDDEGPVWSIHLPCSAEKALAKAARAKRMTREQFLAEVIRKALRTSGGDA